MAYQACLDSDRPAKRLAQDKADFEIVKGGVPEMFVGTTLVVGAPSPNHLRMLVDRALAANPPAP